MSEESQELSSSGLDLRKYWRLICRRRWWITLPAFGIWAAVWTASWFLPALYRSETLILVEQQRVPEQYVVSNVASDLQERLQSMTQQILSRTRLMKIMDQFELYSGLRNRLTSDELVEQMRKDIQIELVEAPDRHGAITAFRIAYLAKHPRTAQEVTYQLSSLFIAENLKVRQEQAEDTTKFLESELEVSRRSLSDQEQRVKDFKSRYLGELPGQVQSNVQILSGLQTQLQQEMEALGHAKQQAVYLESLLSQWKTMQTSARSGNQAAGQAPPAIDQELDRLRAQLADLSSHYTERHPDIRKIKEQIAKTEKMKQQMRTASTANSSVNDVSGREFDIQTMTPVLEVESQLKANRIEIENRQHAVADLEKQIGEYQARLNSSPLREQQLTDLSRDYEQERKNYEALLEKRDQSEMATSLEKRQQGEQFRVLDAPNLPQKPYSPNRLKLSLIGLVAGLLISGTMVTMLELSDDRIYSSEDLHDIVQANILTEIPPLSTAAELRMQKRQRYLYAGLTSAMVALTVAGFGISFYFG